MNNPVLVRFTSRQDVAPDIKDTSNVVQVPSMKAYRGCTSLAPRILNLSTRCRGVINIRSRPPYPGIQTQIPTELEGGWACKAARKIRRKKNFLTLPRFEHRTVQPAAQSLYRSAENSLARPTSRCILFDGENISFDASIVMCINSNNIPPIMIINRIYENQNLLSLQRVSFLVGLRTYQHPCTNCATSVTAKTLDFFIVFH